MIGSTPHEIRGSLGDTVDVNMAPGGSRTLIPLDLAHVKVVDQVDGLELVFTPVGLLLRKTIFLIVLMALVVLSIWTTNRHWPLPDRIAPYIFLVA
jgi:hypothetical protein